MKLKRFIVWSLDELCDRTHWITHHRPVIWFLSPCRLALLSCDLDERWGTGLWRPEVRP